MHLMMCIRLALPLAPCDVGDVCIVCWPSGEKRARHKQIKINLGPLRRWAEGWSLGWSTAADLSSLIARPAQGPLENLPVESEAFGCSVGVLMTWATDSATCWFLEGPF